MSALKERFLQYVKINTGSDPRSNSTPSTREQFDLAHVLEKELQELGLQDIKLDDKAYLTATLPANTDKKTQVVAFLAHLDTSPDMPGKGVNPRIIEKYDGQDIILNKEKNIVLSPSEFSHLKNYQGQSLITTDGNTLLGADDKAGVAEIMTALEYLMQHPEIKHGTIKVAFTPDEEIARGTDHFDVGAFGADIAYTIDGGELGQLQYENFNAAMAKITLTGKNIHPGDAKGKMINSMLLASEFIQGLPAEKKPENTDKYEGFFHLINISGTVEETKMEILIRDHDKEKFGQKKEQVLAISREINKKYDTNPVKTEIEDQYFNMKEKIEPVMEVIDIAREAMQEAGVEPLAEPIRGGTDGARLSYMGLPCPNIFTGGHNFHGRYEYIPLESMEKAVEVIVGIVKRYGKIG